MKTLIFIFLVNSAHAGWWRDFCERHLVAQDPYEFADTPAKHLANTYLNLALDMYFAGWTEPKAHRLRAMGTELRRRPYDFYVQYLLMSYDELEF